MEGVCRRLTDYHSPSPEFRNWINIFGINTQEPRLIAESFLFLHLVHILPSPPPVFLRLTDEHIGFQGLSLHSQSSLLGRLIVQTLTEQRICNFPALLIPVAPGFLTSSIIFTSTGENILFSRIKPAFGDEGVLKCPRVKHYHNL